MPTYDYQCRACDHTWEEFQSMSAAPKRKCPFCGKLKAQRLIGAGAGLIFKGSGFYQTDYKNKRGGGGSSSKESGEKSAASADNSGAKSESSSTSSSESGTKAAKDKSS